MLLVLTVSVSFTSCDEFLAIFDDPVETPDPVPPPEPDPESESNPEPIYANDLERPLTFKALSDGTISVTFNGGIVLAGDIYYTINYGAEKTIAKNTSGTYEITVKKDYVVEIYSSNKSLGADGGAAVRNMTRAVDSGAKYINIKPSMKTEIYGNVMSLLKGKDNFENATTIEANNVKSAAMQYLDDMLEHLDSLMTATMNTTYAHYEDFMRSIAAYHDVVTSNRAELHPDADIMQDVSNVIAPIPSEHESSAPAEDE